MLWGIGSLRAMRCQYLEFRGIIFVVLIIAYSGLHYWVPLILGNCHSEVSKALVEGLGLWVSSLKVEYLEFTNNGATLFASPYSNYRNHSLLVFPRAVADRIASRVYSKIQISKTRFLQNCAVAKMLCFTVLSASLPCAIVSEMHVLKKARGARNTAQDSDFVFSIMMSQKTRKILTPNFAPSSS